MEWFLNKLLTAMIKIYLKSVQQDLGNGIEECLLMRDSNGNSAINNLDTNCEGNSKVRWQLDIDSGIRGISRIWVTDNLPAGKVFKKEPKKEMLAKSFFADLSDPVPATELKDKYKITYVKNDGTENTIDPVIRIPPPR